MFDAEATEYCAATIVSGIVSYSGVTLGTSLRSTAKVRVEEGRENSIELKDGIPGAMTLVNECVRVAEPFNKAGSSGLYIEVESEIPPSKGMKSSSSVSLAVISALLRAYGAELPDTELLRLSATASLNAGVSLTGAFDDAAACHCGGIIFADNRKMAIEREMKMGKEYSVVYSVPEKSILKMELPSSELKENISAMKSFYGIAKLSLYREAALANSLLLSRLLHIDPSPIFASLAEGAVIAGITGTGPAIYALSGKRELPSVVGALKNYGKTVLCRNRGVSADGVVF
jgi:shikimate kinase